MKLLRHKISLYLIRVVEKVLLEIKYTGKMTQKPGKIKLMKQNNSKNGLLVPTENVLLEQKRNMLDAVSSNICADNSTGDDGKRRVLKYSDLKMKQ